MAIEKNFYQDFTERRENKYKPTTIKNTIDNLNGIMYNENKKSTPSITPITDFASKWKEDNKELFKYAGDSAKASVDKGLDEAPSYMKDADEGTSFENVQTASVKRNLAQDSNNDKLHQSALMEMIGHLSKENKEPYLKHSQPLQKYIDVKDEFDFKQNNYTTTKNINTTPDENVRQLQRELNEAGYTDKFGQSLKEDGIYAGKTAYADDSKKADNMLKNTTTNDNYSTITNSKQYDVIALNDNGESFESPSFASADGPILDPQVIADWKNANDTNDESNKYSNALWDNFKDYTKKYYNYITNYGYARSEMKKVSDEFLVKKKGYYTSAWLFEHSLQNNPTNVYRGDGSRIANLVKEDSQFKSTLNDIIEEYKNENFFNTSKDIYFNTGDLLYSIHATSITFSGTKTSNGWQINCSFKDKYDFSKFFSYKDSPVASFANNIAVVCEDLKALTPYDIYVSFTVNIKRSDKI